MRYHSINQKLFVANRKKFVAKMLPGTLALFNSNDVLPTNADGHLKLKQNSDLFYLSGIDQEESILLLFPSSNEKAHREILFVKETNETVAIWEGHKLTKDEARAVSGVQQIFWLSEFNTVFNTLMCEAQGIYLNANEHIRAVVESQTRDARFVEWCKERYPLHHYHRSAPLLHDLRAVKSTEEVSLIQNACNITEKGFRRLLNFVRYRLKAVKLKRERIYKRDGWKCVYCESKKNLTIDHVLPKSRGGKNTWSNLVTCCNTCNAKKNNKTPEEAGMKLLVIPTEPNIFSDIINPSTEKIWKDFKESVLV